MTIEFVDATEAHIPAIGRFFRDAWSMTGSGAPGWAGADEAVIDELTRPETTTARRVMWPIAESRVGSENWLCRE